MPVALGDSLAALPEPLHGALEAVSQADGGREAERGSCLADVGAALADVAEPRWVEARLDAGADDVLEQLEELEDRAPLTAGDVERSARDLRGRRRRCLAVRVDDVRDVGEVAELVP